MKIVTICDNRTFSKGYKKGKKFAGRYIVIYSTTTRPVYPLRLGLTVTKGRGGAVVRNRIKRILRAAWCDVMKRRDHVPGRDIIIVARDAAITAKSTDIVPELESGLTELGVII